MQRDSERPLPLGADEPRLAVPAIVTFSSAEKDSAAELADAILDSEWAGLLDARPFDWEGNQ